MVKNKNSLSLYSPLDDIFNAVDRHYDVVGHSSFTPSLFSRIFDDIVFPDFTPSLNYPISDCYIEEDGTCIIEVAVTGFSKDEININLENNIIKISAKHSADRKDKKKRKYLYKKLATRSFDVSYRLSERLDFNEIDVEMENGLLCIKIPMKESEKPVTKEIKIK